MILPRFLGTNILLCSTSRNPADAPKRERAILSVQVLQEFYVQATRPTRSDPLPHDLAIGLIRTCGGRAGQVRAMRAGCAHPRTSAPVTRLAGSGKDGPEARPEFSRPH
jgi:hypothetical protein